MTQELLNKLYNMGLISSASSLLKAEKLAVSAICRCVAVCRALRVLHGCQVPVCHLAAACVRALRRRLPVIMVRLKMAENLKEAVTFIEQVRCHYTLAQGSRARGSG